MRTTILLFMFVAFLGLSFMNAQEREKEEVKASKKVIYKKEKAAKREIKKEEREEEKISRKIVFE